MRLLLDSHILIHLANKEPDRIPARALSEIRRSELLVSVATFWEIALKHRAGKLALGLALADLRDFCAGLSIAVLPITAAHVLAELAVLPPTRDPFDRLLLAQAQVEGLRLPTLDRALADHPLAWRGPS